MFRDCCLLVLSSGTIPPHPMQQRKNRSGGKQKERLYLNMGKSVIEMKSVSKRFNDGKNREITALDNVNKTFYAGKPTIIRGPSGSGKSTLLKICAMLETPTQGGVELDGVPFKDIDTNHYLSNIAGIAFQKDNLIPHLSVRENLVIPFSINHPFGRSLKNSLNKEADDLLASVELSEYANSSPSALSGGQRARVNLARALMNGKTILLADEPTAALDTKLKDSVMSMIIEMTKERDLTSIVISHDRFDPSLEKQVDVATIIDGVLSSGSNKEGRG